MRLEGSTSEQTVITNKHGVTIIHTSPRFQTQVLGMKKKVPDGIDLCLCERKQLLHFERIFFLILRRNLLD